MLRFPQHRQASEAERRARDEFETWRLARERPRSILLTSQALSKALAIPVHSDLESLIDSLSDPTKH